MAASDFKKLKIILGDIRQRAVRLKIDAEEPGAQEQSGRGKRLAKEFAEGGRMLLCAMGIGVFSNDTVLKKLIEDLSSSKERNLEAGCRDALAHYRLDVFSPLRNIGFHKGGPRSGLIWTDGILWTRTKNTRRC